MINTAQFTVACRAEPAQQISAVVVRARDHGLGAPDLGANEVRAVDVDVLSVRRQAVRDAGELMSEHGNQAG